MSRIKRENRIAPHFSLTWITKTLCLNFHYYAPTKEINSWTNQRQQTELSPAPTEETSVTINVSFPVFKKSAILLLINMWTRPWCKVYTRWIIPDESETFWYRIGLVSYSGDFEVFSDYCSTFCSVNNSSNESGDHMSLR